MPARKLGLPRDVPEELAQGLAAVRTANEVPSDFAVESSRPLRKLPPSRAFLILTAQIWN